MKTDFVCYQKNVCMPTYCTPQNTTAHLENKLKKDCMVPITKPFLPPIEEYEALLKDIWQRNWLTNDGPLSTALEARLKEHLDVPGILYLANGTIALQTAIKALGLKGEIITTPYSFVATTSSIVWEGCKPVFVDIDPATMNIDPALIEAAITPQTCAILATHLYGNPCDIEAIDNIAKKAGLKVIYDAAHCFGSTYKGRSVFCYGDISITSFHATKVYHTIEGGAVFTEDNALLQQMARMRNFGMQGGELLSCVGTNGKNSEFHAAMGLLNLKYIDGLLEKRKADFFFYRQRLGSACMQQQTFEWASTNYSYFPVTLPTEALLCKMMDALNTHAIYPRRYFYPSLNNLSLFGLHHCPHSTSIAARTMCLPIYNSITHEDMELITDVLLEVQKG